MKRETLENIRWAAPVLIATAAATPAVFFVGGADAWQEKLMKYALPLAGAVIGAVYAGLDARAKRWEKELATYVDATIRDRIIQMVPTDLEITEAERQELRTKEVIKSITGVFWETVDADEKLVALKEFFYANGAVYSTALDAYILLPVVAISYLGLCAAKYGYVHLGFSAACIALALIARYVVLPRRRRLHLQLAEEQLDLLERLHRKDIEARFWEIVAAWRRTR